KKPFNHFMPGSYAFGIGTSSCNWGCQFCQNHNISKNREISGVEVSPGEIVDLALQHGAQSIAFTYNEPTISIEYALDVAKLSHKKGLYNLFVTNGFMTKEAVAQMKGLIDAAVVNFKGNADQKFSNKFEMVQSNDPILEAMIEMDKAGIHMEITDLIIPRVGDSLDACMTLMQKVKDSVGTDIPVHFTSFHPDYKMLDYPSTNYETLKAHYDIARNEGFKYVYIGNMPGNTYQNTYCPKCDNIVVERDKVYLKRWELDNDNCCKKCGTRIPITGDHAKRISHREIESLY
ncbi:MAG: AmmeMemoRadiSam system radical SAM enzyme, partial [Candidatus Micrarchaeota archaeon]|nr:AmmeMemoRadiSam system radical SAM enzyme [Candidatus Micrarchaeota archaeon]